MLIYLSGLKASLFGGFYLLSCLLVLLFAVPNTEFEQWYDLEVEEGEKGEAISQRLLNDQVIHNQLSFRLAAWAMGFQKYQAHSGLYQIKAGWNNYQLIRYLKAQPKPSVKVVVHPYQKRVNTLKAICKELDIKFTALKQVIEDQSYLQSWGPFNQDNIYCLFTADTLRVYKDVRAQELADQLVRRYLRFWTPQRLEQAANLGLTPHEVGILASIVYAETKIDQEMPVIAGLYLNRLNKDMRLQADPTVVYAVGKPLRRVLKVHKRVSSAYNTYKHLRGRCLHPSPLLLTRY